ncbi:UNVERIFIED_CONTAM: hypothetical protein DVV56_11805, partial [Lactobacillus acidophilus]|nr:hypothetical protein [Lactobacillus acidophilus]
HCWPAWPCRTESQSADSVCRLASSGRDDPHGIKQTIQEPQRHHAPLADQFPVFVQRADHAQNPLLGARRNGRIPGHILDRHRVISRVQNRPHLPVGQFDLGDGVGIVDVIDRAGQGLLRVVGVVVLDPRHRCDRRALKFQLAKAIG